MQSGKTLIMFLLTLFCIPIVQCLEFGFREQSPWKLGRGLDPTLELEIVKGDPVTGQEEWIDAGPRTITFFNELIREKATFFRESKLDVGLTARYGLFQFHTSFQQFQDIKCDSQTLTWTVIARQICGRKELKDRRFVEYAQQLLAQKKIDEFKKNYGTDFVYQETLGHVMIVLYQFNTTDTSSLREMETQVQLAYRGIGDAAGAWKKIVSIASQKGHFSVRVYCIGGNGMSALANLLTESENPVQVRETLKNEMSRMDRSNAVALQYSTMSLMNVDGGAALSQYPPFPDWKERALQNLYWEYEATREKVEQLNKIIACAELWLDQLEAKIVPPAQEAPKADAIKKLSDSHQRAKAIKKVYAENQVQICDFARKILAAETTIPAVSFAEPRLPIIEFPWREEHITRAQNVAQKIETVLQVLDKLPGKISAYGESAKNINWPTDGGAGIQGELNRIAAELPPYMWKTFLPCAQNQTLENALRGLKNAVNKYVDSLSKSANPQHWPVLELHVNTIGLETLQKGLKDKQQQSASDSNAFWVRATVEWEVRKKTENHKICQAHVLWDKHMSVGLRMIADELMIAATTNDSIIKECKNLCDELR